MHAASQVNLERDHGLGKLMYATWFDVFNIVQVRSFCDQTRHQPGTSPGLYIAHLFPEHSSGRC